MQKLFQSNNIIVKGRKYTSESYDDETGAKEPLQCIELDFTIQVNGRISTFTESFSIGESEVSGEPSINEWSNWYLLVRVLFSMGYYLSDERGVGYEVYQSNSIIKEWTRSLLNSEE